ncbi:hypothetical protein SISSUDRAFT_95808 [Sistotremastrum suecicum HHB10207 ss-3]|uniref:Exportin-T n=1 Tax=Sistotremastrum suecicum HHB10207 ss-3 TaxID=1314776 RepID=A0A166B786_9AGAM|nr:hypothetical protein SISSUDRAFT_95808 [Sistotremastrum suecicum HHB10207 ss-3]
MDVHIDEVVRAILVANDENLAGRAPALRFQALEYLTQFQQSNFTLNLTPNSIPPLLTLLHNTSLAIRSAALQAVTRLLETRVQEPSEEVYLLQLVQELSRGTVLTTLEEKTRADQSARRERGEGDEGEESFREALGRCACTLGREIMQILVTNNKEEVNATIGPLFEEILCLSLHFLADQSDNTSLTVFPFLSSFLESLQRANVTEYTLSRRPFLTQLLTVIFEIFSKGKLTLLNTKQPYNDNNAPKIVRKDLIILFELLYSLEPNLVTETTESYGFNILFNDSGNPFLTEYQTFFKETVNPQMQPSPLPSSAIISSDNNKSELLQGLQDLPSLANKDSDGENTIPLSSISIPYPPFPELLSLVNFERKWLRMELASRDEIIQVVDWAIAVSTLAPDYLLEHPGYPLPEQTGPYFFTITRLDPPIQDPLAERIQWKH